jgi:hypothetical protein
MIEPKSSTPIQRNLLAVACFSIFILLSQLVIAAPKSSPLEFWSPGNENNTGVIDHTLWQQILTSYLDDKHQSGINRFDYAAVTTEDRKILSKYLQQLQQLDPREYNRAEQKAYWINLYNALTVELILANYPVLSITKIGKGFFSFGPWDDKLVTIQTQELSLNNIEHGILRPYFNDKRIHYAVNCASISCPNLSRTAYSTANTEQLLEQGARDYINHPRGVSFENDKLKVSSIYHWYKEDFGGDDKSLIAHLLNYAEPELAKRLRNYHGDIEHDYDWSLNQP